MIRRLAAAAAVFLAALATPAFADGPAADVLVTRDGDVWTADYHFHREAPAWAFVHSALTREGKTPWRPPSWTVETEGVRLARRGRYDVLVADAGAVPEQVRIRFTPSTLDLEAAYDPALVFTTRAVALYTDQFDVLPLASTPAAEALPANLGARPNEAGPTRVTFRDRAGPVLHAGARKAEAVTENGRSYVLFGSAAIVETADIATIIDPALPAWLTEELSGTTPRLLAHYADLLGPCAGARPMLMATWAGPTPGVASMGGSVLPGLVLMALEGERVAERSREAANFLLWFIAHEAAHFWLGQTVDYDSPSHAWMTEGGADLLAVRAIAAVDPAYDPLPKLNQSVERCVELARGRAIDTAQMRSEHDAYYACGAVFGLVAEAAANRASDGGFAGFWRGLIDANRADKVVSAGEWLAALTDVSKDPSLAEDIRRMTEAGVVDPRAEIASLFRRAGVAYVLDGEGRLRLE